MDSWGGCRHTHQLMDVLLLRDALLHQWALGNMLLGALLLGSYVETEGLLWWKWTLEYQL